MKLIAMLAGALALAGCATPTGPEKLTRLDQFINLAIGTWVSEPDGSDPGCPGQTVVIARVTENMRDPVSDYRWLTSRTARNGIESPDSRRVVLMTPMRDRDVALMPYRGDPADLLGEDREQAMYSRLTMDCRARLSKIRDGMRMTGCSFRNPADWLESELVTLSSDEMVTLVKARTVDSLTVRRASCRFRRQQP
ncbi:hypothetical protein [Caulobacter sp. NIBR1757]|uniref:hypothetical protein n=1 Tax=Caulobacter sp. NIBR1757 TaxID=3016000 RepID=UPI0022F12401|nr:hypothetical protein [Caulobacter sp. NIBR1757]WGM40590.1 hypothetical protein AMEJIAPC_03535 [Caulobacter sp. NIBR1757]